MPPIARPDAASPALHRLVADTLERVAAVDLTDRLELERSINLVERLLVVLGEPAPELNATLHALRHAGASQRRMRAAQLYRELAALAAPLGIGTPGHALAA